jgi:anti-anti-sigma factor
VSPTGAVTDERNVTSRVERHGETATVFLAGIIDGEGGEALSRNLASIGEKSVGEVVIDFADLVFIGSSGLAALLRFCANPNAGCRRVRSAHLGKEMRDLLRAARLDHLFPDE